MDGLQDLSKTIRSQTTEACWSGFKEMMHEIHRITYVLHNVRERQTVEHYWKSKVDIPISTEIRNAIICAQRRLRRECCYTHVLDALCIRSTP